MNYQLIKSFYSQHFSLSSHSTNTLFERICLTSSRDKGMISRLYQYLSNLNLQEKSNPMLRWEKDLDCSFSADSWYSMSENLQKCNKAISFRDTPVKLFSRWYLTPSKLHSFYPLISPNCFRGCSEQGTLLHTFWSCPFLDQIWRAATSRFESSYGHKISLTPQICLLYATIPDIPTSHMRLFHSLCSSIQWMIALNWKSNTILWSQVLERMEVYKISEKIYHTLNDNLHIYNSKWSNWNVP